MDQSLACKLHHKLGRYIQEIKNHSHTLSERRRSKSFEVMAALRYPFFSPRSQVAVLLLLVVALGTKTGMVKAQSTCSGQLGNLNVCAPFVVPDAPSSNPSPDCCNALQAVDRDCLCNTIRIASQMPSQCQLPPLACSN